MYVYKSDHNSEAKHTERMMLGVHAACGQVRLLCENEYCLAPLLIVVGSNATSAPIVAA